MDSLIRYAQLAPLRMRLSAATAAPGAVAAPQGARAQVPNPAPHTQTAADALRAQIESELRAEFTAQAQVERDEERARAQAAGYDDGIAAARAAAAAELERARDQLSAQLRAAVSALEEAQRAALARLEAGVGEVAFAAVCRLAGDEAVARAFVLGLVEQTCAQLRADVTATARMHPRDIRALGDLLHDGALRVGSLGLSLLPDESLALGGVVLEAASGRYDGGLETQLRRLHAVLSAAD